MARVVKEQEYAARRNEILDATQRLIATKGYEQMTIQDILNDLQISKGAFYHYFDSKQALLEALIARMLVETEQIVRPILDDPRLSAIEKFQSFFDVLVRWKVAQKSFMLALLRTWYADDNLLVRQKLRAMVLRQITPMFALIIRQGIQEGAFKASYPDQVSEVILALIQDFSDTAGARMLACELSMDGLRDIMDLSAAYTESLERTLQVPAGSLHLLYPETWKAWMISPEENVS
jgi:AcrR family transcriptional regulator